MPTWPETLPNLELGASETRQDGVIRTEMDAGPAQARRRFSAITRAISGRTTLDKDQFATLETFFSVTLSEGSISFTYKDPRDLSDATFRFTAPPSVAYVSGGKQGVTLYEVSLSLEILP